MPIAGDNCETSGLSTTPSNTNVKHVTLQTSRTTRDRRSFLCESIGFVATGATAATSWAQDNRRTGPDAVFTGRTRRAAESGLDFLATRQTEDGAFGIGPYRNNLAVCGLCGMAFLSAGSLPGRGKFGRHLNGCVRYILANARPSGFIQTGESDTRGPMYEHGFATLFLAESYGTSPQAGLRTKLAKAVELIVNTQNDEGGWRYQPRRDDADVSVTVCQVMALRAAHNTGIFVPKGTIDRAIAYVVRCQNDDGGFSYQAGTGGESRFPRSAAALVAMYSAGIYDSRVVKNGLDYVMQFPPDASATSGDQYFFYGHYYAAQAMWHAGGKYWQGWYPAVRDVLLARQRDDGSWSDTVSAEYGTAMACIILRMPESYLPIFER